MISESLLPEKKEFTPTPFYEFSRASLIPLGRVFTIRQNVLHGFATKNARLHALSQRALPTLRSDKIAQNIYQF